MPVFSSKSRFIFLLIVFGGIIFADSFKFIPRSDIDQNDKSSDQFPELTSGCNSTHFEFWNNQTFARSTLLNKVFDLVTSNPIPLYNITKKVNDSTSYKIYDTISTLVYHNEKQTAEILRPDGIILITDGFVQVKTVFYWARIGPNPANGTGTARGMSQEIAIAMRLKQKTSNMSEYQMIDYLPFSCENLALIELTGNFSEEDKTKIGSMVNTKTDNQTLRLELESQVSWMYLKYLNWFFNDKSPLTNQEFTYYWQNPAAARIGGSYSFTRNPNQYSIMSDGIRYGYETIINDYTDAKCGPEISKTELNPRVYGGMQSYISNTFLQNVLKTAVRKYQLDTKLNRRFWVSRFFNFMVGELYDIIPNLSSYSPQTDIEGSCTTDVNQVKISKFSDGSLNVSIVSRCNMTVQANPRVQFTSFEVKLQLQVVPKPYEIIMDFWLKSFTSTITFFAIDNYPIANKGDATKLINSVLEKLYENKLFGSGWSIYPNRLYPEVIVDENMIFIYEKFRK